MAWEATQAKSSQGFEMSNRTTYDPRYLQGIEYFNQRDFFEAHEVWEDLWRDESGASRSFYKGLIQVAVCLHHFGNGNGRGTRKLYHSCRGYLQDYVPRHRGLDVEKLLSQLAICCAEIVACQDTFPRIKLNPELLPEIHLDPRPQPQVS
jgi:predicted metal-dependent hydrolase